MALTLGRVEQSTDAGKTKAARPRDDNFVVVELEREIVGDWLDRNAMSRRQGVKLDEAMRPQEAARRPERGHDEQSISNFRVREAMELLRRLERDHGAGALRRRGGAGDSERPGRFEHEIADRDDPGRAIRFQA